MEIGFCLIFNEKTTNNSILVSESHRPPWGDERIFKGKADEIPSKQKEYIIE